MGRRKEHMSTYIRPDQLDSLNSWAERLGKPKAVIVRAALDQHFRRLEQMRARGRDLMTIPA